MGKKGVSEEIYDQTRYSPLFYNSFIVDNKKIVLRDDSDHNYSSYANTLLGNFGYALSSVQNSHYLEFLSSIGLLPESHRIIQIPFSSPSPPYQSLLEYYLSLSAIQKEKIVNLLPSNVAFYPNFITPTEQKFSSQTGIPFGNVSFSEQENAADISALVHSKSYLRQHSLTYNVPEGVIFKLSSLDQLFERVKQAIYEVRYNLIEKYSISFDETKNIEYWLKMNTFFAGGDGVVNIKNSSDAEIYNAIKNVKNIHNKSITHQENNFFILEGGVNSIPHLQNLSNVNIQALIFDKKIIPSLPSIQKTSFSGEYLGNEIPLLHPNISQQSVADSFVKVCETYQSIGYRGLIGGDAFIFNDPLGNPQCQWFDINPRMNSSHSFQEQYRIISESVASPLYGVTSDVIFSTPVDFNIFYNRFKDILFTLPSFGVIPVSFFGNVSKVSTFAQTSEDLAFLLDQISKKI